MAKRAKREKRPVEKIDFKPYGARIKAERMKLKESRNKVGSEMFLSPRYIANIENNTSFDGNTSFRKITGAGKIRYSGT